MPRPLPNVYTREASGADFALIVGLLASTPDDGELYQRVDVLTEPDGAAISRRTWLRQVIQDPHCLVRLAILQEGDTHSVIGFSNWVKMENDPDNPSRLRKARLSESTTLQEDEAPQGLHVQPSTGHNPHLARQTALNKKRESLQRYSELPTPFYEAAGLAVHPDYQGRGVGSLLMRWGMDAAAIEGVPVLVAGETRGVAFYKKALGFRPFVESEWWLDRDGREVSREEVQAGSVAWMSESGGVSGAQLFWLPDGVVVEGIRDLVRQE